MLVVVVDKEKIFCTKRCLHDIDAKDIMILRCLALKKFKKGEVSTWLIDTLRGFMTREKAVRLNNKRMMCITKIKEKRICNAYFALAIGYSRRGLNLLISEICEKDHYTSIHGNRHYQRE